VAKHADKWNGGWGLEEYRQKLNVLKKHCESVGRDISKIGLTYTSDIVVANTKREAEELIVDWRKLQSKVLGKTVEVNMEKYSHHHIVDDPEGALRSLKRIVRELKVSEFILYNPFASNLDLMKLLYNEVVDPLKEYAEQIL